MLSLISNVYAADSAPAPQGADFVSLLFPILLLVVFYFLLIRPQQKRAKEHKALVDQLKVGDSVMTTGG
ncbi:MAG: preprotein translocase subunit YajC, partial [Gammaproteobacteria bacterium]|nr:preprotein translocase subunit YajC [Gammaproteobacteria bacterium]